MLLKAAMPFNFSSPEYLSHHRMPKNRASPVSRASPAHMNSPINWLNFLVNVKRIPRFSEVMNMLTHHDYIII